MLNVVVNPVGKLVVPPTINVPEEATVNVPDPLPVSVLVPTSNVPEMIFKLLAPALPVSVTVFPFKMATSPSELVGVVVAAFHVTPLSID